MLNKRTLKTVGLTLMAIIILPVSGYADDSPWHKVVDGIDVYLGIMPAEITQGHPARLAGMKEHETHYHLLIAVFDARTGKRITDAEVRASVVEPGGASAQGRNLEPMRIMEAPTYGNYFRMSGPGKYRLRFDVRIPARKYAATAEFFFNRNGVKIGNLLKLLYQKIKLGR